MLVVRQAALRSTGSARRRIWLFDLDNTLHNASHAIFPQINRNMNACIARVLGAAGQPDDEASVNALRQLYYQRYGVTMLGMVRHYGVRAEEFLQQAHQFDDLPAMIRAERGLARRLRALPGHKILLTNGPQQYARQVLQHLKLHKHFSHHIAVESMRVHGKLQPKPSRPFLRRLLARHRWSARDCILVEDSVDNLRAAKREGLKTVLLHGYVPRQQQQRPPAKHRAACIDYRYASVRHLLRAVGRM
ncbi:pyrimidine 5'-nucleotidase [Undibacterium curvum]|uniref:Pyrimidine 5'-nucleotidase n=1 Tax=Undibacterium curvum TaxID=2762294 RepID=A0ABR7A5C1_9BURK|nr:pyrimidine 5'-nucleotidase [Undibacterium curvum]MBC3932104.1 pyrimidine 5'-nucleotidase [Undibacterium curvum]